MSKISLTDFVDIVSSAGMPKANKVIAINNRENYHPAFDYCKGLRDHIIQTHKTGAPKALIKNAVNKANNKSKLNNYQIITTAYHSWWGRKEISWFDPKSGIYQRHGVEVSINPELGLEINGVPHLVKLYFKSDSLTKNKVDIITYLMESELSSSFANNTNMSVLDIRRKKLITGNNSVDLNIVLSAELAYAAALLE